ncbi:LNK1-like protein isoform X1 [Tanacetum coccineum]
MDNHVLSSTSAATANLDDVDKMLRSCDSSFGLGVTNKDNELRWFTSAHVDGTEEAIKMGFKFSCSEPSGLKNMLPNNDSPASNNQRSSCISESKHEYHIENQVSQVSFVAGSSRSFHFHQLNVLMVALL